MPNISQLIRQLFTRLVPAAQSNSACSLLERAGAARGLSAEDAALLRINALAMLRVVR
jgi:hypothetical protein